MTVIHRQPKPAETLGEKLDMQLLTKELDKTKSNVYLGKNAAFLGPLQCSMNFVWSFDLRTAATDGVNLYWNPYWFLKLKPSSRVTVFVHELWHPAKLHFLRLGSRIPKVWNFATDISINNDMIAEGYDFSELQWAWKDPSFPRGTPEEDIYDSLIANARQPPPGGWENIPDEVLSPDGEYPNPDDLGDMLPSTSESQAQAVNNAVRAAQQAKQAGFSNLPGDLEAVFKQFLAPVVPWEQVVHQFMRELTEEGYSWRRPNRRFSDVYLPSRSEDEGALSHLIYFEDVSSSMTDGDVIRVNSEFKYVKEIYKPKRMTLVQFDTKIQQVLEYEEDDPFEQVKVIGRGGTCLKCVREYMIEHKPTAAIIFSDMECQPMEKLPFDIPTIWIAIRSRIRTVPFGKLVHIRG